MKKFEERRKVRKILYSRVSFLLLLLLVVVSAKAAYGAYQKNVVTAEALRHSTDELAALKAREGSLGDNIKRLDSDRGKEAELRTRYQVAKDGEEALVLVGGTSTASTTR